MLFDSQKRKNEKASQRAINQRAEAGLALFEVYKANERKRRDARNEFDKCIKETQNDPTIYLGNWEYWTKYQLDQLIQDKDKANVLPLRDIKKHEDALKEIADHRNSLNKWTRILYWHNPRLKDQMERVENLEKTIEIMSGELEGRYEQFQKGAGLDLEEFKTYRLSLVEVLDIMRILDAATLQGADQNTVIVKTQEFIQKGVRYDEIRAAYLAEQKKTAYESPWGAMGAWLSGQKKQQGEAQYEQAVADYMKKQGLA